jgi:hypothetical protein
MYKKLHIIAVTVFWAAFATHASAISYYRIVDLDDPALGSGSQATALNNSNTVVGAILGIPDGVVGSVLGIPGGQAGTACVWQPEAAYAAELLGSTASAALDINNVGTICGSMQGIDMIPYATVWRLGAEGYQSQSIMTNSPSPMRVIGWASGIDSSDNVCGLWVYDTQTSFPFWGPPDNVGTVLQIQEGAICYPNATNDNGIVCGVIAESIDATWISTPTYWINDGPYKYPVSIPSPQDVTSYTGIAADINSDGIIVGWTDSGGGMQPFVYNMNTGLHLFSSSFDGIGQAQAVNDAGVVVGVYITSQLMSTFIWSQSEGFADLNDLVERGDSNLTLTDVRDINMAGTIVGVAVDANERQHAVMLVPIAACNVSTSVVGQGSVSPASGQFFEGDPVEFSATPDAGWQFDHWQGDLEGSQNPITVTISSDMSIAAVFAQIQYTLTVNVEGAGTVETTVLTSELAMAQIGMDTALVQSGPGGSFPAGTVVMATAVPSAGWQFDHWQGDLAGSTNPASITMDADKTITAVFTQIPIPPVTHTLAVTVQGQGSVSPSGGTYDEGTPVTVTATPSAGWQFDHWQGDLAGSTNPASITMDADKTITAVFTQIPIPPPPVSQGTLTVSVEGQGSVSPAGGVYDDGTAVTLIPTPAAGWHFDHWKGDLAGSADPASITMNADKTITAVFTQIPIPPPPVSQGTLTVSVEGQGSVSPAGGVYDDGTAVTLIPTPAAGWHFDHWKGDLAGSADPASITMTADMTITAVFVQNAPNQSALVVRILGKGTVVPGGGMYENGTELTLLARPADGWTFSQWQGDVSEDQQASNTLSLTISGNRTLIAVFVAGSGTISPPPDTNGETTGNITFGACPASGLAIILATCLAGLCLAGTKTEL